MKEQLKQREPNWAFIVAVTGLLVAGITYLLGPVNPHLGSCGQLAESTFEWQWDWHAFWQLIWGILAIVAKYLLELFLHAAGVTGTWLVLGWLVFFFAVFWALVYHFDDIIRFWWDHPIWGALLAIALIVIAFLFILLGCEIAAAITVALADVLFVLLIICIIILLAVVIARLLYELWSWIGRVTCPYVRVCARWTTQQIKKCRAWKRITTQECQTWGTRQVRRCLAQERRCISWTRTVRQICCNWWPCSWACGVLLDIVEWSCSAYGVVCTNWYVFREAWCVTWRTIASWLCEGVYWVVKAVCAAWKWVFQC